MPFKTITIKNSVYKALAKTKNPDESFSELFSRMLHEKRPDLSEFYGAWKLDPGEDVRITKELKMDRERLDKESKERQKRHRL